jgi:hypothetical protein
MPKLSEAFIRPKKIKKPKISKYFQQIWNTMLISLSINVLISEIMRLWSAGTASSAPTAVVVDVLLGPVVMGLEGVDDNRRIMKWDKSDSVEPGTI